MKLLAQVRLQPFLVLENALRSTVEASNRACNHISEYAWRTKVFGQDRLRRGVYDEVKRKFGLCAQMVIRCIARVSDAYGLDPGKKRVFDVHSPIIYDDRILRWVGREQFVSIWTVGGRMKIPYVCGRRSGQLLQTRQGETCLVLHDGRYYLIAECNIEDPGLFEVDPSLVAVRDDMDAIGDQNGLRNLAKALSRDRD